MNFQINNVSKTDYTFYSKPKLNQINKIIVNFLFFKSLSEMNLINLIKFSPNSKLKFDSRRL